MLFTLTPSAPTDGYDEAILSLSSIKSHLRIDDNTEDDLLQALRGSAIDLIEQFTSRRLGPTTDNIVRFNSFGSGMRIALGPSDTLEIQGIDYIDASNSLATMSADDVIVDVTGNLRPSSSSWPAGARNVVVTFSVGYPADKCPAGLVQAVRMFVAYLWTYREEVQETGLRGTIPLGVRMACSPYLSVRA